MKFNKDILKRNGFNDEWTESELINLLQSYLSWLMVNNKNYTKKQYYTLEYVLDIVQAIESEE